MAVLARTMARMDTPTSPEPTRIAVIADPHVAVRSEMTTKLLDRTRAHLASAVADANDRNVDAVVSVGDLTKDGEPWNFAAVDEVLQTLEAPFMSVPGNHDVPKQSDDHETPGVDTFGERYAPGEFPFIRRVGGIDVVGLNTAGTADFLYDTHDGAIPADRIPAVEDTLAEADTPVVVMHHNLPAMYDRLREHRDAVDREMSIPPTTRDPGRIVSTLADTGVPLVFTGHLHFPATAVEHGVREVMAPTTCSYPQAYLLVEIDGNGTKIEFVPIADRDGLRFAHAVRSQGSPTGRGLAAMAAVNLARFPLVDER